MHKLERVVIYSGLALSICIGLGWQGFSSTATARSAGTLAPEPAKIATCDVLLLVDKALLSERYFPVRDAKAKELNAQLKPAGEELMAAEGELIRIPDRESQPFKDAYQAWIPKKQAYEKLKQDLGNQFDEYNTSQAVEAYRLICEAVAAYAKNNGYTHVIATRSSLDLKSKVSSGVVQEANSRPVVYGPTSDDITDFIARELKIDVPAPGAVPAEKVEEGPPMDPAEKAKLDAEQKVKQQSEQKAKTVDKK